MYAVAAIAEIYLDLSSTHNPPETGVDSPVLMLRMTVTDRNYSLLPAGEGASVGVDRNCASCTFGSLFGEES